VKRTFLTIGLIVILSATFVSGARAAAASAKTPAAKDACSDKKTKYQHDQCESFVHSAPGDEYFGRMKMSYLGINNTFHDEFIRAGAYTTDPGLINKVGFADEALRQWARRYPGDPQLARSYFLAIQVFKKIYTKDAQDKAWSYMNELVHQFGSTYFGKLEKKDLAIGFTEHYFALPQMCPTPLPSGAPLPSITPAATPTPAPKAGQPKVDVITPPCVEPSPAASPTVEPTPGQMHYRA
jgi:hypothetical protein